MINRWALAEPELKLLPELCPRDSLAIDIGAHKGLYTWFLLQRTNRLVAFEPLPAMQALLLQQYGDRISIQPVALSDQSGECALRFPAANYGLATISPGNRLATEGEAITTVMARTAPLDGFEFQGVGFMKIDVEGHEEAVLRGARATLVRERPNLLIEIEERHAPGATMRVPEFLKSIGYAGFYRDGTQLVDIADFASARDQPPGNISGGTKGGRYINNFIFVRSDQAGEMRPRLERALTG